MANISTRSMSNEEKLRFWIHNIQSWNQSDLSQADYCRQNNINQTMFIRWKRKISDSEIDNQLIEVPKKALIPAVSDSIDLIINDSVKIKLTPNFNAALLKSILDVLGLNDVN